MPELGIVIVSHSADIAKGLVSLIREVAPDIPLTATGCLLYTSPSPRDS